MQLSIDKKPIIIELHTLNTLTNRIQDRTALRISEIAYSFKLTCSESL